MARRMYDLDNGVEKIKVASLDTSKITSNGNDALEYDSITNTLIIGTYDLDNTYILGDAVVLDADSNGSIKLESTGISFNAKSNTFIKCGSPLRLSGYTTALRPSNPEEGLIIYDSTLKKCILYNGTAWVNLDGTALS